MGERLSVHILQPRLYERTATFRLLPPSLEYPLNKRSNYQNSLQGKREIRHVQLRLDGYSFPEFKLTSKIPDSLSFLLNPHSETSNHLPLMAVALDLVTTLLELWLSQIAVLSQYLSKRMPARPELEFQTIRRSL